MRVLFTTWGWPSHLYPMVPVAWACRAAGHDVRVATQPGLADVVAATGLPLIVAGSDVDAVSMVRRYAEPADPGSGAPPAGAPPAGAPPAGAPPGGAPPGGANRRGPRALEMVRAHAEDMADDLLCFARAWRPDLVVHEPTSLAGAVVGAALGVPVVRTLFGPDLLFRARDILHRTVADLCERLGVQEFPPLGDATIDPCPPALQLPVEYPLHLPVRYVPYNGTGPVPEWISDRPRRPRVCVTWGHTMAKLDPDFFLAGEVIRSIADLDVEIVAVVTARQAKLLDPVPAGVRIAESAPLHVVAPTCDVLLGHGGAGTILTGLSCGLPQLHIPRLPDHRNHSRQLAGTGAGLVVPLDEVSPERIAAATTRLLDDPAFAGAAGRLGRLMAARPAPLDLVPRLERLAGLG